MKRPITEKLNVSTNYQWLGKPIKQLDGTFTYQGIKVNLGYLILEYGLGEEHD